MVAEPGDPIGEEEVGVIPECGVKGVSLSSKLKVRSNWLVVY